MAKVIMVQGTMSNAGKSLLVAGLCRVFKQDGYRVAPFKSQNMALNSFITEEGLEMGRAQVMQAEASGIKPDVCMNPILLKPTNNVGSQVIVNGEVMGNMKAKDYFKYKTKLIPDIIKAFKKLEKQADIIVIEGAGSPVEINLKENDIVNMGMAKIVDAPVLLVGDIDRGGVFAQLLGTLMLLDSDELDRVKGLVINKFRGDKSILDPGIKMLEEKGKISVSGVIPYTELQLEDEDSLSERFNNTKNGLINIAVVRYPRISNFTDFNVFDQIDEISVKYVTNPKGLENADIIILPGSKNTISDLEWLRMSGMEAEIKKRAGNTIVFGICGGYQMLGDKIIDDCNVEGNGSIRGMELLKMTTRMEKEKTRMQVSGILENVGGCLSELNGLSYKGYEIHMGRSTNNNLNVIECNGNVYGSYVHGLFDSGKIAETIVELIAKKKGIKLNDKSFMDYDQIKEKEYDRLADVIREYVNMDEIYSMLREVKYSNDIKEQENYIKITDVLKGVEKINSPNLDIYNEVKKGWDSVAKPIDSLGEFEIITSKIGAILGTSNIDLRKKAIITMCADNGIVEEKVSQSGQEVTLAVAKSMAKNNSSVGKLASYSDTTVISVDIGINSDEKIEGVLDRKISYGTKNFLKMPAMTYDETLKAIQTGMDLVADLKKQGYKIIGTGEMGIGNTTTSTCIVASILKCKASEIVGRGAGLSDDGLKRKEEVIDLAIEKYDLYNANPLDILSHVGGLDIAGIVGVIIGGAVYNVPIVLDGLITLSAALVATKLVDNVKDYIIPSHMGKEPAVKAVFRELNIDGILHAKMALGEGTGCAMLFPLLDMALNIYNDRTTFEDIDVEAYRRF